MAHAAVATDRLHMPKLRSTMSTLCTKNVLVANILGFSSPCYAIEAGRTVSVAVSEAASRIMEHPPLAITDTYTDKVVLLTGGLGFLGSTVLEQLLRNTEIRAVYLLVRGKRTLSAAERVQKLLCCPLFSQLHKQVAHGCENVFCKVKTVAGDLSLPGLGLSDADAQVIRSSVDMVIHCAANVVLDADIQGTLRDNYLSTKELMHFCSSVTNLRSFVHTSTFFVNNHLPRNTLVKEQIHHLHLQLDGRAVSHEEYVAGMMAKHPLDASRQAAQLMQDLDFTSTYAFGKHLTEQLVNSTCIKPGVAKAIVRPSLISGLAGAPYPGWISGYAGSPGYCMGYALGFFQGTAGVAYASDMIIDLIPCDTVAQMVIAAAAAAACSYGSAAADQAATIYHACSSESHPLPLPQAFDALHMFWTRNPACLCLPLTGYAQVNGPHHPTTRSLEWARQIAWLKLQVLSCMLRLCGRSKEAFILWKSFEAFNVQNTIAYDRSMVCSVSNGRKLLAAVSDADRETWKIVWEPSQMSWREYTWTFLAGVRRLLFRMQDEIRGVPHYFIFRKAAEPGILASALPAASDSDAESAGVVTEVITDVSADDVSDDLAQSADLAVHVQEPSSYSSKVVQAGDRCTVTSMLRP